MPLHIVQNDITQMNVDAIVNAADPLLPGDCPTGSARLTAAYGAWPFRCSPPTAPAIPGSRRWISPSTPSAISYCKAT